MTKYSVVIVTYNTRDMTLDCLKSLYANMPPGGEVYVVDNASSDGSAAAIREAFPEAIVIENDRNGGFSQGNNLALARAKGEYSLLLNSDTIVLPNALHESLAYLETHPKVGAIGCRLLFGDGSLQPSAARLPTLKGVATEYLLGSLRSSDRYPESRYESDGPVGCVIGAYLFVRATALGEIGLLDEGYFMNVEDVDYCKRLWDAGWEVHYVAQPSIVHLTSQSIKQRPFKMAIQLHKNRIRYFYKFHGLGSATITALFIAIGLLARWARRLAMRQAKAS